MPEQVRVDEEAGLIEVRSFGRVSAEDIEGSIAEVGRLCAETGITHVLVDGTETETMPSVTGTYRAASGFPRGIRIAVLLSATQPAAAYMRFGETVAQNRGVAIKLFRSRDAALAWLRG